jgi:hypothetical protein
MDKAQWIYGYAYPYSQRGSRVRGALCEDGKRRTATITADDADTYFTIPARVSAKGKTVAGFITSEDDDYQFNAYAYRKNGHILRGGA